MITSIEIAKLLSAQRRKDKPKSIGFDSALLGLGVVKGIKQKNKK